MSIGSVRPGWTEFGSGSCVQSAFIQSVLWHWAVLNSVIKDGLKRLLCPSSRRFFLFLFSCLLLLFSRLQSCSFAPPSLPFWFCVTVSTQGLRPTTTYQLTLHRLRLQLHLLPTQDCLLRDSSVLEAPRTLYVNLNVNAYHSAI